MLAHPPALVLTLLGAQPLHRHHPHNNYTDNKHFAHCHSHFSVDQTFVRLKPNFQKKKGRNRLSPVSLSPQIYPDESHFLHGDATRQHLSRSLVNFFEECFRLPEAVFEGLLEEEEGGEDEG